MNYLEKWKSEVNSIRYKIAIESLKPPPEIPPPRFKFVSFILPLMLIPLAIKGATEIRKAIKKQVDKNKEIKEL